MGSVLASSPRARMSPSSRWAPLFPRRTRRSASPRNTRCSTASAAAAWWPGLPLGSPMDVNLCYGITPMEQRERYREAFALTLKAWQSREIFAWNGRYYQLANVNLWPRPIQDPAPPGLGAGLGQRQHLRLRRRARRLLLLPQLLGGPPGQGPDGRLLGGGREATGASPTPTARVSSSSSRVRDGRQRRGRVRTARRVLLPQVPPRADPVVLSAGEPGLPEPALRRPRATPSAERTTPRISATATSRSGATSSPGARRPSASASRRKS